MRTDRLASRFFLPGPTAVRPEILAAMTKPMIAHRGAEMRALLARVHPALSTYVGTRRPVYISAGAATGMMESAVRCGSRARVLALVTGGFGERFARIADSCGRTVTRLLASPGETIDPGVVADALEHGEYDAVTAVHVETSTGVVADIAGYGRAVAAHSDVMLLVDAVASLGGMPVEMDVRGLDVVLSASQKALALPPGLSFIACSERVMARARELPDRGTYLDVVRMDEYWQEGETAGTPAISQLYALDAQVAHIAREGLAERFARHEAMLTEVEKWLGSDARQRALGARQLAAAGVRAPTVSCLEVACDAPALRRAMRERGFEVGAGYGSLDARTIRLGHMGDHTVAELRELLAELALALGALAR